MPRAGGDGLDTRLISNMDHTLEFVCDELNILINCNNFSGLLFQSDQNKDPAIAY